MAEFTTDDDLCIAVQPEDTDSQYGIDSVDNLLHELQRSEDQVDHMRSVAVISCSENGFPTASVKDAIQIFIARNGHDQFKSEDLVRILYENGEYGSEYIMRTTGYSETHISAARDNTVTEGTNNVDGADTVTEGTNNIDGAGTVTEGTNNIEGAGTVTEGTNNIEGAGYLRQTNVTKGTE